jgi:hypothetical protein
MRKLFSTILVICSLLSGNAYSEIIEFSKCANERDNFKFRTDLYEENSYLIDLSRSTVERVAILTDSYFNKLVKKNPDSGQPKYIVQKDKIHSYNEYVVITKKGSKSDSISFEKIFDLKSKKIQSSFIYKDPKRNNEVSLRQCQ